MASGKHGLDWRDMLFVGWARRGSCFSDYSSVVGVAHVQPLIHGSDYLGATELDTWELDRTNMKKGHIVLDRRPAPPMVSYRCRHKEHSSCAKKN
jgi:hypothetical protein